MLVEVTNRCNHACVFCMNNKMTRKKGEIDSALLVTILKQAHALGVKSVGFYSTGEPLMFKDIDFAVGTAKRLGYEYIYLTTNGALADLAKIKGLVARGLDSIKFSINALSSDTYRLVHGRDDYEQVLKNVKALRQYRDDSDVPLRIGISYVVTDDNRSEVAQAKSLFEELADDTGFFEEGNQGGYMSRRGKPSNVVLPCNLLFNRIHISCEGYLTLCCVDYQDYLAVADLRETSLADAWTTPAAVGIRERHLAGNVEGTLCYNCVYCKSVAVLPLVAELATIFDFESGSLKQGE